MSEPQQLCPLCLSKPDRSQGPFMRCSDSSCGLGTVSVLGFGPGTWERLSAMHTELAELSMAFALGGPFRKWAEEYLCRRNLGMRIGDRYDERIKEVLLERDLVLEEIAERPCAREQRTSTVSVPACRKTGFGFQRKNWCAMCLAAEALGK